MSMQGAKGEPVIAGQAQHGPFEQMDIKRASLRLEFGAKPLSVKKVEVQEALPPAGVIGAEPLTLVPQHFFRKPAKRCLRALTANLGFFDRLKKAVDKYPIGVYTSYTPMGHANRKRCCTWNPKSAAAALSAKKSERRKSTPSSSTG